MKSQTPSPKPRRTKHPATARMVLTEQTVPSRESIVVRIDGKTVRLEPYQ